MNRNAPELTIVLGTYNRLTLLKQCLGSFLGKLKIISEVVVIDAGSTDGTRNYLNSLKPQVRSVLDSGKIGQAKSINRVVKTLKSPYVCWISDDNMVEPQVLDEAVHILATQPQIGMVALKVHDVTGPYTHLPYIGGMSAAGILTVNQGVLPLSLFAQVGYFDEAFPDYGIDVDLTAKILLSGKQVVYTKDIAISHYRDYKKYPGAFAQNERTVRLQKAQRLYEEKYPDLCRHYRRNKLFFFRLLVAVRRILSFFVPLASHSRDWNNILRGQYISFFDLWYHRHTSYYLVQDMKAVQNVP